MPAGRQYGRAFGLVGQLGDDRSVVRWPEPGSSLVRGFCIHNIRFHFDRRRSRENDVNALVMLGWRVQQVRRFAAGETVRFAWTQQPSVCHRQERGYPKDCPAVGELLVRRHEWADWRVRWRRIDITCEDQS